MAMFNVKTTLELSSLQKSYVFRSLCKNVAKGKLGTSRRTSVTTFGQPTYQTHPYLLKKEEVTPSITRSEYQDRRQKLVESVVTFVGKSNPDIQRHLIVIPSATKQYMSDKIPYVFRQNTEFLYLTGCQEPDSCVVLTSSELPSKHRATLFVREKDDHSELWDGPRTGPKNAPALFGVHQSLPMNELENYLQSYLKSNKSSSLWYDFSSPVQTSVHKVMIDYLKNISGSKTWESPIGLIHKQRLIKSPAEVSLMRKSCDIASEAIGLTIKTSKAGSNEHELFAKVDYECRMRGAEFLAYPPVIAGGNRANTIHYINNNQVIDDGDMVLMDAGCEYHGYASDITRTWPINGKFNPQQRELYDIVHKTQSELIQMCNTFPTLDSLFNSMCLLLGKSLQEHGLLPKSSSHQSLMKSAYQFCPHHVSHYLGMDVHDTPLIPRSIPIQPGMVITVEPGLYISHKHNVPEEFRGIGVRMEDDVLITEDGPVVLSQNCPNAADDIEELAKENQ